MDSLREMRAKLSARQAEQRDAYRASEAKWTAEWDAIRAASWKTYTAVGKVLFQNERYDARASAAEFFESQKARHPIRKSLRFYPSYGYERWLAESVRACDDSLELYQGLLQYFKMQRKEAAQAANALDQSFRVTQTLFDGFAGDTNEQKRKLFMKAPSMDNYSFNWTQFPDVCWRAGFLPLLDMCCDALGTNSMCPFYYSAGEDATRQSYVGQHCWCNPPYKNMRAFIDVLERDRNKSVSTRAILVIPRTYAWLMKPIYEGNAWRRVQYWHKNAKLLFRRPARDSILGGRRRALSQTVQAILVLVLGRSSRGASLQ